MLFVDKIALKQYLYTARLVKVAHNFSPVAIPRERFIIDADVILMPLEEMNYRALLRLYCHKHEEKSYTI